MKKVKILGLAVLSMSLLCGCSRFDPDQTAMSVKKNGAILSYIKETFDKDYYNQGELESTIDKAIQDYNSALGTENIKKKKFQVKDQMAELQIEYATGEDYSEFNDVTIYTGDVLGAYHSGYDFNETFQSVKKGVVTSQNVSKNEILNSYNYGILILDEALDVQVPGNIVYASSNVQVTGKNTATVNGKEGAHSSGKNVEHETDAEGIISIAPVSAGRSDKVSSEDETAGLSYILYE